MVKLLSRWRHCYTDHNVYEVLLMLGTATLGRSPLSQVQFRCTRNARLLIVTLSADNAIRKIAKQETTNRNNELDQMRQAIHLSTLTSNVPRPNWGLSHLTVSTDSTTQNKSNWKCNHTPMLSHVHAQSHMCSSTQGTRLPLRIYAHDRFLNHNESATHI